MDAQGGALPVRQFLRGQRVQAIVLDVSRGRVRNVRAADRAERQTPAVAFGQARHVAAGHVPEPPGHLQHGGVDAPGRVLHGVDRHKHVFQLAVLDAPVQITLVIHVPQLDQGERARVIQGIIAAAPGPAPGFGRNNSGQIVRVHQTGGFPVALEPVPAGRGQLQRVDPAGGIGGAGNAPSRQGASHQMKNSRGFHDEFKHFLSQVQAIRS